MSIPDRLALGDQPNLRAQQRATRHSCEDAVTDTGTSHAVVLYDSGGSPLPKFIKVE